MVCTTAPDLRLQSSEFDDANNSAAHNIEHFHDFRVVWPSEVPEFAALDRNPRKLVHCAPGILLHGARESNWILSIQHGTVEDYPGSNHSGGLCGIFSPVS